MGALNIAFFFLATRAEIVDYLPSWLRPFLGFYLLVYAGVALFFFLEAIESLRPRRFRPHVPYPGEGGPDHYPEGLRYYEDIVLRDLEAYRRAWREVRFGQLNAELAVQNHVMARINLDKFRSLRRLYGGLRVLTILAGGLLAILALSMLFFQPSPKRRRGVRCRERPGRAGPPAPGPRDARDDGERRRARGVGHRLAPVARPLLRRRRPRIARRARALGRRGRDAQGEGQPGGRDGPRPERARSSCSRRRRESSWSGIRPRPPRPRASLSTCRDPRPRAHGPEPGVRGDRLSRRGGAARRGRLPPRPPAQARAPRDPGVRPRECSTHPGRLGRRLPAPPEALRRPDRRHVERAARAAARDRRERRPAPRRLARRGDRRGRGPAGRPAGGARPRARRRALGRRREAGAAALPGGRKTPSPQPSPRKREAEPGRRDEGRVRHALFAASALAASGAGAQEKKPEPPPGWEAKPFSLENPSAGFKIALKGYVQADFSSYRDWTAEDADGNSSLPPEFEWQRARIGLEGEWRRLSFEVDVDPAFDEGDELKDAWIEPAPVEGLPDPRRQHEGAGEPGVPHLAREDRLRRAQPPSSTPSGPTGTGAPSSTGRSPARSSTRRGSSPATTARVTAGRGRRRRRGSS